MFAHLGAERAFAPVCASGRVGAGQHWGETVAAGVVWQGGRLRADGVVALVGAGPTGSEALDACLSRSRAAVAADGGAETLLRVGRPPDAVIGDLDSLPRGLGLPPERVLRLDGQDDTDFEKCMGRIDAPLVLGAGFLGGRMDHALAALGALARGRGADARADGGAWPPCVLVGEDDIAFAVPERIRIELPPGCRVSLFPMAPSAARSTGLEWPLDGLALAPMGRVGTSNRATGPVEIETVQPGLLCLLPPDRLDAAIAALAPALAPV